MSARRLATCLLLLKRVRGQHLSQHRAGAL